jgi:hypothetical protein
VLRNLWLIEVQTLANLVHDAWPQTQELHDAKTIRLGQHRECLVHLLYILAQAYARQGIFDRTVAVSGTAEEITIPIALQIDLIGRVVRFERTFGTHAEDPALVVVVQKRDTAASERAASQAFAAIEQAETLGGRRASATIHTFSSAASLFAESRSAAIVYVMPGFNRSEHQAIAAAFIGASVLTVGASAAGVESGMVLGFELESSTPRIVINLSQARAQRLDFSARLLRLARVIE